MIMLLAGLLAGCGGRPRQGQWEAVPESPPPPPPQRQVTLDPGLVETARGVIEAGAADPDRFVRAHAMEAVKEAIGPAGLPLLMRGLSDVEPVVRFAAAMAAGELRLSEAHDRLLAMADDPDVHVQIAVRFALHRLGNTRFSRDLELTARHDDPSVRANTVLVLGLLEEPSALRVLRALRRDTSAAVRLQVAEAMWRLGDREALPVLVSGTISAYPDDQMIAVLALAGRRDPQVAEHVRGRLVSRHSEVALVAARAMGMIGSDEGYVIAAEGTRSNDPRHRLLAALAFGEIGRTDAQALLRPLLSDGDAGVRLAAATALLQLEAGQSALNRSGRLT